MAHSTSHTDLPLATRPTKPSDNLCKALAEKYPDQFLQWIFGRAVAPLAILKTELQREPVRADAAMLLAGGGELFHIEFQTSAQSHLPLPLRMLDYYVGFKRNFPAQRIRQALVILKDTGETIPDCYEADDVTCRYTVIRLWECDAQELLAHEGLLPLAALCRTVGTGGELLRTVASRIAALPDPLLRREQIDATRIFAGLRYSKDLVQHILRRTDMLEESVIYQEILERGMSRGLREGHQQGLQEGRQEGESTIVLRLLTRRFGTLTPYMHRRVATLSSAQLEQLGEELLDFPNRKALSDWLRRHRA